MCEDVKTQTERKMDELVLGNDSDEEKGVKQQSQLDKNLEDLLQFSLIEQETLDKAGTVKRFRVSPFVDQYIANKMDNAMKKDQLGLVCMHLKSRLIEFKKEYGLTIIKCEKIEDTEKVEGKLLDQIRPYEQQIMHIVYHIIQLDDETSTASEIEEFEMETDEGNNTITEDTKKKTMHKKNISREVVPSP